MNSLSKQPVPLICFFYGAILIKFDDTRWKIIDKYGEIVKIMRGTEFLKDFSTKTYAETMLRRHLGKKWREKWENYRIEVADE